MTRRIVIFSLAIVMFLTLPALASHEDVTDKQDVAGRLDVRRVKMTDEKPREWFITTYQGHRAERIFDKGYFLVYFDVRNNERFDYYLLLRPTWDGIKGNLWRDYPKANDEIVGRSRVRHPSNRTIRATVPFRRMLIPEGRLEYSWQVRTIFTGKSCRRVCIDKAPDVGTVTELFVPEVEPDS